LLDAFDSYKKRTGATLDPTTGFLTISASRFAALQDLNFNIGGNTYPLSANAQIWPRSLNSAIGGTSNKIYLIVVDVSTALVTIYNELDYLLLYSQLGSISGQGFDFVDGYAFLERFYSVFDTTNNQVGFATTKFTTSTAN
jgi:saccharopepsin